MLTAGRASRFLSARVLGLAAAVFLSIAIFPAQAGPPLITNDPDTPGAGAWEINVAATGAHTGGVWDIDAPDLDINRGVGDRVQLSLHLPWSHRDTGGAWMSGIGAAEFGVRWRFLDQARDGMPMHTAFTTWRAMSVNGSRTAGTAAIDAPRTPVRRG